MTEFTGEVRVSSTFTFEDFSYPADSPDEFIQAFHSELGELIRTWIAIKNNNPEAQVTLHDSTETWVPVRGVPTTHAPRAVQFQSHVTASNIEIPPTQWTVQVKFRVESDIEGFVVVDAHNEDEAMDKTNDLIEQEPDSTGMFALANVDGSTVIETMHLDWDIGEATENPQ